MKTVFWKCGAYFETASKRDQFRVWTNPGKPLKTIESGGVVTWAAIMDDFGNLVRQPSRA